MIAKFVTAASVVGAMSLLPAEPARADAGDFIGGAIVGGLITGAIINSNQNANRGNTGGSAPRTYSSIPATQQGRETQTALNYFGYNAGSVDGQIGAGTRAAIERFQADAGFPVNGREFSAYQFSYLMDAYYWGINGGAAQTSLAGRPLLAAYRQSLTAPVQQAVTPPVAPPPTTVIVNAPQPQGGTPAAPPPTTTIVAAPVEAAAPAPAALPNLFQGGSQQASLANRCNAVMLQTTTNGGYTTLATMTDANFTLEEQFCVARSYAISEGEDLIQDITGLTAAQISEQCSAFGDMLGAQADAVSLLPQTEAVAQTREFALGTGISPVDLSRTAKVCLAIGYREDDMRLAVGSALLLTALGETPYGELLGHHLVQGFGTTNRRDLATQWFEASLTALEDGATPVFMPGQPERVALLRAATGQLTGTGSAVPQPTPAAASQEEVTVPTFGFVDN
ncbi:peptidoglycan-binding protein [Rhodobacterales bacterium HKCCE2091]|nr:peptidoglycan-binding protein [Rhodobacterales bacterium HKCCE2091]